MTITLEYQYGLQKRSSLTTKRFKRTTKMQQCDTKQPQSHHKMMQNYEDTQKGHPKGRQSNCIVVHSDHKATTRCHKRTT